MKSVLISIQPKWCELIASGKKTVEVRKNRPRVDTPFKCYIYQTLHREHNGRTHSDGKVIGEFVCNEIYLLMQTMSGIAVADMDWCVIDPNWFRDASCLTDEEICNYLKDNDGFAWLISDLVIYDKPKELSNFWVEGNQTFDYPPLTKLKRPPQSWYYVEVRK